MSKDNYENRTFSYNYPYTWERRNRSYLKLREDRPNIKDYIIPLVFRLRFYNNEKIVGDDFYTSTKNKINFPDMEDEGVWVFEYNGEPTTVTPNDYDELINAINEGYDDIKLSFE